MDLSGEPQHWFYVVLEINRDSSAAKIYRARPNANGSLLAWLDDDGLFVLEVPRVLPARKSVECTVAVMDPGLYGRALSYQVGDFGWHPASWGHTDLVVLGLNGIIRMHNIMTGRMVVVDLDSTFSSIVQTPVFAFHGNPTTSLAMSAGSCHLPNDPWIAFTVFVARENGELVKVCPLVPAEFALTVDQLDKLDATGKQRRFVQSIKEHSKPYGHVYKIRLDPLDLPEPLVSFVSIEATQTSTVRTSSLLYVSPSSGCPDLLVSGSENGQPRILANIHRTDPGARDSALYFVGSLELDGRIRLCPFENGFLIGGSTCVAQVSINTLLDIRAKYVFRGQVTDFAVIWSMVFGCLLLVVHERGHRVIRLSSQTAPLQLKEMDPEHASGPLKDKPFESVVAEIGTKISAISPPSVHGIDSLPAAIDTLRKTHVGLGTLTSERAEERLGIMKKEADRQRTEMGRITKFLDIVPGSTSERLAQLLIKYRDLLARYTRLGLHQQPSILEKKYCRALEAIGTAASKIPKKWTQMTEQNTLK